MGGKADFVSFVPGLSGPDHKRQTPGLPDHWILAYG